MEYDESVTHNYYHPYIRSGLGFGAQRWIATLQRQCEFITVMSSPVPSGDNSGISRHIVHSTLSNFEMIMDSYQVSLLAVLSSSGRRSIAMLARRVTRHFCNGVCATYYKWESIQLGTAEESKFIMRKGVGEPGDLNGMVLSASRTLWLPITHERLSDFLRNEQTRGQWDVLSQGGSVHRIVHIAKGQDPGNSITLFRTTVSEIGVALRNLTQKPHNVVFTIV